MFCSDTEEGTSGGGKRDVHKLFEYSGEEWKMIVGTAGFGPLCDVGAKRIGALAVSSNFLQQHEQMLGEVMAQLYRQYISVEWLPEWKQQDRRVQFVIGIVNRRSGERLIYQTEDEIVSPVQHRFACAGVGQEIAYYLLDQLFDELPQEQCKKLLAFVMGEAKQSVGNVGGNTEMVAIRNDHSGVVRSRFAPGWDAKQPRLGNHITKFWMES